MTKPLRRTKKSMQICIRLPIEIYKGLEKRDTAVSALIIESLARDQRIMDLVNERTQPNDPRT